MSKSSLVVPLAVNLHPSSSLGFSRELKQGCRTPRLAGFCKSAL